MKTARRSAQRKPVLDRAIKISISMPARLYDEADTRRRALQLSTFSDYMQHAARTELGTNGRS